MLLFYLAVNNSRVHYIDHHWELKHQYVIASRCIPKPEVVDFNGEEDEFNSAERSYIMG